MADSSFYDNFNEYMIYFSYIFWSCCYLNVNISFNRALALCRIYILILAFEEENMNIFIDSFLTFSRIGVLTFGGGYAMLPILQREVVENKNWATDEELVDYYAIGQTTPGIIAVNTSTFIGQKQRGALGGIVATLGFVFPSYIIITLISMFMQNFSELAIIQNAFAGIRVSVYILILNAVLKLWKNSVVDKIGIFIFALVFILSVSTSWSPVIFIILAAFIGVATKLQEGRRQQK